MGISTSLAGDNLHYCTYFYYAFGFSSSAFTFNHQDVSHMTQHLCTSLCSRFSTLLGQTITAIRRLQVHHYYGTGHATKSNEFSEKFQVGGGGVHFQSKKLYCRFRTFTKGFVFRHFPKTNCNMIFQK